MSPLTVCAASLALLVAFSLSSAAPASKGGPPNANNATGATTTVVSSRHVINAQASLLRWVPHYRNA